MTFMLYFMKSGVGRALMQVIVGALLMAAMFCLGYADGRASWKAKHEQHLAMQAFAEDFQAQAWATTLERLRSEQADVVVELEAQLKTANGRQLPLKVVIKEVTKYVTIEADANCSVPDGFKWVYNSTLQTPTDAELAGSRPRNVDAPSGLTLSGVAAIAGGNNAECVHRGEIIKTWQGWYLRNKASFERLGL
jgi:hypothetical protein